MRDFEKALLSKLDDKKDPVAKNAKYYIENLLKYVGQGQEKQEQENTQLFTLTMLAAILESKGVIDNALRSHYKHSEMEKYLVEQSGSRGIANDRRFCKNIASEDYNIGKLIKHFRDNFGPGYARIDELIGDKAKLETSLKGKKADEQKRIVMAKTAQIQKLSESKKDLIKAEVEEIFGSQFFNIENALKRTDKTQDNKNNLIILLQIHRAMKGADKTALLVGCAPDLIRAALPDLSDKLRKKLSMMYKMVETEKRSQLEQVQSAAKKADVGTLKSDTSIVDQQIPKSFNPASNFEMPEQKLDTSGAAAAKSEESQGNAPSHLYQSSGSQSAESSSSKDNVAEVQLSFKGGVARRVKDNSEMGQELQDFLSAARQQRQQSSKHKDEAEEGEELSDVRDTVQDNDSSKDRLALLENSIFASSKNKVEAKDSIENENQQEEGGPSFPKPGD